MTYPKSLVTLSLSLCLFSCSGSIPLDALVASSGASDKRLSALETQMTAIQEKLKGVSASQSPTASIDPTATMAVKDLQVQPTLLSLTPKEESQLDFILLIFGDDKTAIVKNYDMLKLSSSDESIVTIDKNGKINALGTGSTMLQVKLGNVSKSIPVTVSASKSAVLATPCTGTASCAPTPTPTPEPTPTPTPTPTPEPTPTPSTAPTPDPTFKSISVDPDPVSLTVGATSKVKVILTPTNSDEFGSFLENLKAATWASADETIVAVSEFGVMTALKVGTTTITVKYKGHSVTYTVKVTAGT